MAEDIKVAKESVRNEIIIKEVKAAGNVARQFLIALITAILAPIIIAAVLLLGAYEKFIPSPPDLVPRVSNSSVLPLSGDPRK